MAFRRHPCRLLLVAVAGTLLSQLTAGQSASAQGPGDVAVYWGRNKDEGTLREACDTGSYTTVLISFLSAFGHGKYELDLSGHPFSGVGDDIKHCQSKGIHVLLSIGGQGGEYSLPSSKAASDLAEHLWDAFLAGGRAGVPRPFGDARVDGVDFFIDQGGTEHYDELATMLHGYNTYYRAGEGGVALTATPRCAHPDQRLRGALDTLLFGRIHVRLYGGGDDLRCTWAPRESWEKWAAAYPGSLVSVGVVASPEADRDAYMSQKDLYYSVLQFAQKAPNYGGIMIWNRYYDKMNHYTSSSSSSQAASDPAHHLYM